MSLVRSRVYYGWYVVGVALVGSFLAGGLTSQVFFSVMLKPLTEDLGWTRTEVSGAITLGTLAGGFLSPISGTLVDRYGPRWLAPLGALVICGALLLLASVQSLVVFYVSFIVARAFSSATMTGVVSQSIGVNWFRRMRGRVLGMLGMAVPLGGSFGAIVAQPIIDGPGWRAVFHAAPILLLFLYVLPAFALYRRRPEDLGLKPDGDSDVPGENGSIARQPPAPELSWTVRDAFRTKALWLLLSATFIGRLASGAVSFHLVAYYTDKGMSGEVGALSISLFALFGAVSSFIWGFLIERMPERLLLAGAMLLSGFTLLFMIPVETAAPGLVLAALFGLAARGEGALVNTVLAQYFGRASFGRIAGFASPINMAALGVGPLVASISFDVAGSYTSAFAIFTVGYLLAAALLWLMRPPRPPAHLRSVLESREATS